MESAGILAHNRVSVFHEWPRGPEALDAVREWKRRHPDCVLVIIDMLQQISITDPQYENSYAGNVDEITAWTRLSLELDICILATTHNKKGMSADFVEAQIGSTGKTGSASVIWSLKRTRGKADAVLYATGWDLRDAELPLEFMDCGGWKLLDGTASEHAESAERLAIIEVLKSSDEALSSKDIALVLQKNPATTRWHLFQMVKANTITKEGRGKFTVNA
jgi:hypothetical protein